MTLAAGNTTKTLQPREVTVLQSGFQPCLHCQGFHQESECPETKMLGLVAPDIDQVAPVISNRGVFEYELPEVGLTSRVIRLEEQMDALLDRIAAHNVKSAYKI